MERLVLARLAAPPEQLERAARGSRCEREERHVRLATASLDLGGEEILHRIGRLVDSDTSAASARASTVDSDSSGSAEPPPNTFFISLAESPVCDEWASSMITA